MQVSTRSKYSYPEEAGLGPAPAAPRCGASPRDVGVGKYRQIHINNLILEGRGRAGKYKQIYVKAVILKGRGWAARAWNHFATRPPGTFGQVSTHR